MNRKILIVDDSTTARMFIRRCFEIAGCWDVDFLEAADGKEGLDQAKKHNVELIVTDLNMPNMDGTSFLRRAKGSPRLNPVPVIVITSLKNEEKVRELLDLGAEEVLSKPITPTDVLETLQKIPGWGDSEEQ